MSWTCLDNEQDQMLSGYYYKELINMRTDRRAIGLDTLIVRISGVVTADMDGEIGMLHMEKGMYYALNDVGTRIWQMLEKPETIRGIIDGLRREYAVDADGCREQVLEFLEAMHKKGLIEIAKAG